MELNHCPEKPLLGWQCWQSAQNHAHYGFKTEQWFNNKTLEHCLLDRKKHKKGKTHLSNQRH